MQCIDHIVDCIILEIMALCDKLMQYMRYILTQ